jgi:hypothetical protein
MYFSSRRRLRDTRHEAVSAFRQRLDKSGSFRVIAQELPKVVNRLVDGAVEVHVCVTSPDAIAQLFPGHHLTARCDEHRQNMSRLLLQPKCASPLTQFSRAQVKLEVTEPEYSDRHIARRMFTLAGNIAGSANQPAGVSTRSESMATLLI